MRPITLPAVVVLVIIWTIQAGAWNETGHMVIASLAYSDLKDNKPEVLAKVHEILKAHPHYEEFLIAQRPPTVSEQEWSFLRASVWPDWVRDGPPPRRAFNVPDRHFINRPLVRTGDEDAVDQAALKEVREENVLSGLTRVMKQLEERTAPTKDLAVDLCWLLHLAGDVHQPLHCRSLFSKEFPKGDHGGNLFYASNNGKTIKLHAFWDDLLGARPQATYSAINLVTTDIRHSSRFQRSVLKDALDKQEFGNWVEESAALAGDIAYNQGNLKGINLSAHHHDAGQVQVPALPEGYEDLAKDLARRQAATAGFRLSDKLFKACGD